MGAAIGVVAVFIVIGILKSALGMPSTKRPDKEYDYY